MVTLLLLKLYSNVLVAHVTLHKLAELHHFLVCIQLEHFLLNIQVLRAQQSLILLIKHRCNVLCEPFNFAVVVRPLDQDVLRPCRLRGLVHHPLLHFVGNEVVLEYLHVLYVLYFIHEFLDHQMGPCEIKPTQRPVRIATKELLGVGRCFLQQLLLPSNEHLELV